MVRGPVQNVNGSTILQLVWPHRVKTMDLYTPQALRSFMMIFTALLYILI